MTEMGRRVGGGDMLKSVYDSNNDGVIAVAQTEADMTKAAYDPVVAAIQALAAAHKTQHQTGGTDEISCALLSGRINYVDSGDPAAAHKATGDFTVDGLWHPLDLSAFVPANAVAIQLRIRINDDFLGAYIQIRKNGNSNAVNTFLLRSTVIDIDHELSGFVPCNSGRVIEYRTTNTAFTTIALIVKGWLI